MKTLILVDGNYQIHRSVYPGCNMKNKKGFHTGGLYIFLRTLWSLSKYGSPVVVFDYGHSEYRKSIYPDYKKKEPKPDDAEETNLSKCFSFTFDNVGPVLTDLGVPNFKIKGQEADDVIYLLAKSLKGKFNLVIATDDFDYLSFFNIDKSIKVYQPMKDKWWSYDTFVETFSFDPIFFPLYKSFTGDSSDNIPGVPGIGDVTAKKIIVDLKDPSIESLINWLGNPNTLLKEKTKEKVRNNLSIVKRNLLLMDLEKITLNSEDVVRGYDRSLKKANPDFMSVVQSFRELEFTTLPHWVSNSQNYSFDYTA